MENIIKKAIDGGYFIPDIAAYDTFVKLELIYGLKPEYCCVLDPIFWQSLGKECGWGDHRMVQIENSSFKMKCCLCEIYRDIPLQNNCEKNNWKFHSLYFHEINLTEGWDKAVEWLNDLIK